MFSLLIVQTLLTLVESRDLDLSTSNTWRCGVFIPVPDEKFQEPLAKYFVFHKKFKATCPAKLFYTFSKGVFSKKCSKMAKQWEKIWSPSRQRLPGKKYGDEVCDILNKDIGMTNIPNEAFPEGVKFGFFYNYCGADQWKDTTVRSDKTVCCQEGKYRSCDKLDGDADEEKPQTSATNVGSNGSLQSASKNKKTASNSVVLANNQHLNMDSPAIAASDSTSKNGAVALNKPVNSAGRDDLTNDVSNAEGTKYSDKLDDLKEKLENGLQLNEGEIEEVKQFITGLKYSASQLLKVAKEYEKLLDSRNSV